MINQTLTGKKARKGFLSVVISVILIVTVFTNTAFADTSEKYDVTIVDGQTTTVITTTETEPIEILKGAGITLSSNDKLDISGFVSEEGGEIVVDRYNTIYVQLGTSLKPYGVYGDTVKDALNEVGLNVSENDEINFSLDTPIEDGMVIIINSAMNVTVLADGEATDYAMLSGTVSDLLDYVGITLGENDYTLPSLDTALEDGMVVGVYRVEYKEETVNEAVQYSTTKINDSDREIGDDLTYQAGVNGAADVTYKNMYINGEYYSREELSRKVTKEPVEEIVYVGTALPEGYNDVTPNGTTSWNGYTLGQIISGKYSHYCACSICNGNSRGVTSSGLKVYNGMTNPYYVACNWLPLGSVIDVDGTLYTVADRGGSGLSTRGRIDIFTPEGHAECYRLGVGKCTITIVRLGW